MWSWIFAAALALAAPSLETFEEHLDNQRFDEARQTGIALLALREKGTPPNPLEVSEALIMVGLADMAISDHGSAEVHFARALELRRSALGPDHPEVANTAQKLARSLKQQGRYDEADSLYTDAVMALRKAAPGNPEHTLALGVVLNDLAHLRKIQGQLDVARRLFEESIEHYAESPDDPEIASALSNLAGLHQSQGRYEEARQLYGRALSIYADAYGEEHHNTASVLNNLATLDFARGDYATAQARFEKILEIWKAIYGEEHPLVAACLSNLAVNLEAQGHYREARVHLERVLRIRLEANGEDHPAVATSLHNLAGILARLGEYAAARPRYERSLAIRRKVLGRDSNPVAATLNDIGGLLDHQGDYAGARVYYEESLRIRQSALDRNHPDIGNSLNNLGMSLKATGNPVGARPLLERSLEIREKVFGDKHPTVGVTLGNLAGVFQELDDVETSIALYEQSLDVLTESLGPEHVLTATAAHNLAGVYTANGRYDEAQPLYVDSLKIARDTLGDEHPHVADTLVAMANLHTLRGEPDRALVLLEQAMSNFEGSFDLIDSLSEREAMKWLSRSRVHFDTWLAAVNHADRHEEAWTRAMRVKGAIGARHRVAHATVDLAGQDIARELAEARRDLARLAFAAFEKKNTGHRRDQLAELSQRKEALERDLLERSAGFRLSRSIDDAEPAALCHALAHGEALVDILRYKVRNELKYLAFVLRYDDCRVRRIELGDAGPIENAVADWREVLDEANALDNRVDGRGTALAALVWEPLQEGIGDATRVIVVPDGTLSSIPFGALPTGKGYLVEQLAITYLDRANDLLRPPAEQAPSGALVVGGVDYDATTAQSVAGDPAVLAPCVEDEFPSLPGASEEAATLAGRWSRLRLGAGLEVLGGGDATETAVANAIRGKAVAHLATHGFFATGRCQSALEGGRGFNPMLLSGLVFAGANQPPDPLSYSDGILTAEEVASIDLRNTGLVVLSACETGLGEIRSGEGVLGLRRAFAISGVHSLIMSLWSVPDSATAALLDDLYRHYLRRRGVGARDALRTAQLAMLERNRRELGAAFPHTWASFVAAGR